jgi:hypothetical protein
LIGRFFLSSLAGGLKVRGPWVAAQAMIQGVLETDEFADERVVAAVGTRAFGGELSVEIKFGSVIKRSTRREKSGAAEAWSRHPDKAGWDARAALLKILQALKDSIRTG